MKYQFSKMLNRSAGSAAATMEYNHNSRHPDHYGHTEILESVSFRTEALDNFGGWKAVDKYETRAEATSMKEIIESLPSEWSDRPNLIKAWSQGMVDWAARQAGVGQDRFLAEVVIHNNNKDKGIARQDNINLHAHIGFSERLIDGSVKYKTYKKDYYQDPATGRMIKTADAIARGLAPTHRKGEIKLDKDGRKILESKALTEKKLSIYHTKKFIGDWKHESARLIMELDPSQKLQVGREDPNFQIVWNGEVENLKVPVLSWTRKELNTDPERIEKIKSINESRRELNKEIKKAIETNDPQVIGEVRDIVEELRMITRTPKEVRNGTVSRTEWLDEVKDKTEQAIDLILEAQLEPEQEHEIETTYWSMSYDGWGRKDAVYRCDRNLDTGDTLVSWWQPDTDNYGATMIAAEYSDPVNIGAVVCMQTGRHPDGCTQRELNDLGVRDYGQTLDAIAEQAKRGSGEPPTLTPSHDRELER